MNGLVMKIATAHHMGAAWATFDKVYPPDVNGPATHVAVEITDVLDLAREIADDVVKNWTGDVTGPKNVWACVERAVISALSESHDPDEATS